MNRQIVTQILTAATVAIFFIPALLVVPILALTATQINLGPISEDD